MSEHLRSAEDVAREVLGDETDGFISDPIGFFTEAIRARDAEVRADERAKVLAGFTEWFAPGFTYPGGRTVAIGREVVAREFAAADARDMASPEDATPTLVVRRLVGPWEPTP